MDCGAQVVAAARAMVGVPFRLHGRSRESGVDCVGLVMLALEAAGQGRALCVAPARYSIRGGHVSLFHQGLTRAGLRPVECGRAGDVVLVRVGVGQFHLMIATSDELVPDGGHIHAHAGLGRVVEMSGESPWPVLERWRLNGSASRADRHPEDGEP